MRVICECILAELPPQHIFPNIPQLAETSYELVAIERHRCDLIGYYAIEGCNARGCASTSVLIDTQCQFASEWH